MKNKQLSFLKVYHVLMVASLLWLMGCGVEEEIGQPVEEWQNEALARPGGGGSSATIDVDTPEAGSAIYINGIYDGQVTPASIQLGEGTHQIGVGLANSEQYLRRTLVIGSNEIGSTINLDLDASDLQAPKHWKALFVGVNQVQSPGGSCVSSYTTAQLDSAYEYFQWSFTTQAEPFSYNTMDWSFERRDISNEVVTLSSDNLITPSIFEQHITDIQSGDYDLIVTFFNSGVSNDGSPNGSCQIQSFIAIAWFDVNELSSQTSYYTVRFHNNISSAINYSMANDPGLFVHEWLHTTAEMFYPNQGVEVPSFRGQVVHAAEHFGYTHPWMTWYRDIMRGQVLDRRTYKGIGPENYLSKCSVRESALGCN